MYLKRLELHGFKSFPDKSRLDFGRGITAVVGPNGSGKSNVSDALRWALGEGSAKSLRGARMEDVIFAGTASRRPLGFAEVNMIIDNGDRALNIDFEEIAVTRRLYRSGESQYMINDSNVRLKDVLELFMDTGVGREGYSIIGQGRIDEILNAKSEERRLLFEEAAGIVKYRTRKSEATVKLERERANLTRVNDIIDELEVQLGPLEEQSETAKRYLKLAERQKLLNVNLFLLETENAAQATAKIEENIGIVTAQAAETKEAAEALREEAASRRLRAAEITAEIEGTIGASGDLSISVEQLEGRITLAESNIEHENNEQTRIREEIAAKKRAIDDSGARIEAANAEKTATETERASLLTAAQSAQTELDTLASGLCAVEARITAFGEDHIDAIKGAANIGERISRNIALYEQFESRKEELDAESEALGERLDKLRASKKSGEEDLDRKAAQTRLLKERNDKLFDEKYRATQEHMAAKSMRDAAETRLRDALSRRKALVDMERSHEGFYGSVKAVLTAKEQNPNRFGGVIGAVAELIAPNEGYEIAVETALGGAAQNIVVADDAAAKDAITYLKEKKAGRATFLPLNAVKERFVTNRAAVISDRGVLGTADGFVTFDGAYSPIIRHLLANCVVCDTYDNASALARKYKQDLKIVTKEGELFSPGGAISGGGAGGAARLLSRASEITKLSVLIDELTENGKAAALDYDRSAGAVEAIGEQIEKNRMLMQEIEVGKANTTAALEQNVLTIEELSRREAALCAENNLAMERIVALNAQTRKLREEQRAEEERTADVLRELNALRTEADEARHNRDKHQKSLHDTNVNITKAIERIDRVSADIGRIQREAATAGKDIAALESAIADSVKSQNEYAVEIESRRLEIKTVMENIEASKGALDELRSTQAEAANAAGEADTLAVTKLETCARLEAEIERLNDQKERKEEDSRAWFDRMWDEYGVTKQAAMKLPRIEGSQTALAKEERDIRGQIRELGVVNVAAIEEFTTVGERYTLLKTQRDDIVCAEGNLVKIIDELEAKMSARFIEQFSLISESFNIVFAEMFGGGAAGLKLCDDGDALTATIDIIARPPGKRLQNMNLFSGGERALTATALLFAILRMKPSPFCVLDEVEAALDDANIKRFANFLQNFSGDTQFIVITHRKGTMEVADTLYGVTMQEQGVSKIVGVKFG